MSALQNIDMITKYTNTGQLVNHARLYIAFILYDELSWIHTSYHVVLIYVVATEVAKSTAINKSIIGIICHPFCISLSFALVMDLAKHYSILYPRKTRANLQQS